VISRVVEQVRETASNLASSASSLLPGGGGSESGSSGSGA
jgi:hypothetical protein